MGSLFVKVEDLILNGIFLNETKFYKTLISHLRRSIKFACRNIAQRSLNPTHPVKQREVCVSALNLRHDRPPSPREFVFKNEFIHNSEVYKSKTHYQICLRIPQTYKLWSKIIIFAMAQSRAKNKNKREIQK